MTDRYLEDLEIGEKTQTGSVTITETQILDFSRQYDPQQGRVVLDGVDVRDLRLADLRGAIATVAEDTFLFSTTVAANIPRRTHSCPSGSPKMAVMLLATRTSSSPPSFPPGST